MHLYVAGQFVCGSKKCPEKEELRSWEVNFAYVEQGEKKNALVKLRKLQLVMLLYVVLSNVVTPCILYAACSMRSVG